ncbi:VWA domain-containing protein [Dictyobacter arantiisoli]|uniref:UPF0353 protein n=1 Tax=Dictyobacter arantiisoli TaxID=2014874 RepID=A0A5A5TEA4_9CHLR|nr:VWA domain-containing protein [Dictyobacter arantiisoli]GCF09657.1 UPF0353 protein [Dictyobacter arantiisoli]
MTFQWPFCLFLLLLIPLLIWLYLLAQKKRSVYAVRFTNLALLGSVVGRGPGMRRHVPAIIFGCALAILILSLARPTAILAVPQERANVMLVFDVSGSMGSQDMHPSRIMAARQAAHTFINALPGNVQIGVVSFNNVASLRTPLTLDRGLVQRAIDSLTPGGGTAIGDGLNTALDQFQQLPRAANGDPGTGTVVLLSDGANNMGTDPALAALRARNAHIKVNTIGIGARGNTSGPEGQPGTGLDEAALQAIAHQTNGHYFYAGESKALQQIYADLSSQISWVKESTEITAILSMLGAFLFLTASMLSLHWFQRFP